MKKFSIKAYLAAALSHRLNLLDGQLVADTVGGDSVRAIRDCQRVIKDIERGNEAYMKATGETKDKLNKLISELKKEHGVIDNDFSDENRQRVKKVKDDYEKKAPEISKESKAEPEVIATIELGDYDYDSVLMPLFKKTVGTWDERGDGSGQTLFLEVADALEVVKDC